MNQHMYIKTTIATTMLIVMNAQMKRCIRTPIYKNARSLDFHQLIRDAVATAFGAAILRLDDFDRPIASVGTL